MAGTSVERAGQSATASGGLAGVQAADELQDASGAFESPAASDAVELAAGSEASVANDACDCPDANDNVELATGQRPPFVMEALLWAVSAIEGADVALLPCSMFVLSTQLGLSLNDLAVINLVQSLLQTLSAPIWAILADRRTLSRKTIFMLGAGGQGAVTCLLALVTSWYPMLFLRALNGVLLASLRPVAMGLVADVTSPEHRGKVYGNINLSMFIGMLVATLTATPASTSTILGLSGWRVMFTIVGCLSIAAGACVPCALGRDAEVDDGIGAGAGSTSSASAALAEARRLLGFFRLPTFSVLILQGVFGSIGMSAGAFATMYYQLTGISSAWSGVVSASGLGFVGVGMVIGGHLGDCLSKRFRHHGRIVVAEVSLFMGIPLKFLTFWGVEPFAGSVPWLIVLNSLHGLLAVWCVAAAKLPLLSEIVPAGSRSTIMAWDSAIEGSWGTLLGGPLVAVLAQSLFGFTQQSLGDGDAAVNAEGLGRATATMICGPALVSALCWFLLHWTYPRDAARAAQMQQVAGKSGKAATAAI